jgi:thymidylate synthase
MKQYLDALRQILDEGIDRDGRNGFTRAVFVIPMRFKMADGFPATTTKKLFFNQVKAELLWFLSGSTDVRELQKLGCHIWDKNANASYWKPKARFEGDLGPIYGYQWRNWKTFIPASDRSGSGGSEYFIEGKPIDQIAQAIDRIKHNPYDRRIIVSAWNVAEIDHMALPPCHRDFQFFVANGRLSLHMNQRSCDMFLGVPFNIASYSLLLHMVAQVTNLIPHECIITLNDAHIYHVHFAAVNEQLKRIPGTLPTLKLNPEIRHIDDFKMNDIELVNYDPQPSIRAEMVE